MKGLTMPAIAAPAISPASRDRLLALGFVTLYGAGFVGARLGLPHAEPFAFLATLQPQRWGAEVFALGLWIALPLVSMLLFVNLVLGVISRVASQLSVFAIGFPITLGVGLVGITATLPLLLAPFTMALERMLSQFQ